MAVRNWFHHKGLRSAMGRTVNTAMNGVNLSGIFRSPQGLA